MEMKNMNLTTMEIIDTLERILTENNVKNKSDAMALYFAYTKHIWKGNLCLLQVPRAAEYLSMSENRIRKARQILTELGVISTNSCQDDDGVVRHFVELHPLQ